MNSFISYLDQKSSRIFRERVGTILKLNRSDGNPCAVGMKQPQMQSLDLSGERLQFRRVVMMLGACSTKHMRVPLEKVLILKVSVHWTERPGAQPKAIACVFPLQLRAPNESVPGKQQKLSTRSVVSHLASTLQLCHTRKLPAGD